MPASPMPTTAPIMNVPSEMAMAICRRVPPFTSSRRPLTHALGHSQWPEPPNFVGASTAVRLGSKSHRLLGTRLLGRCRGARALRDSLRRCRMPSCGANRHPFSSKWTSDASETSASRACWGPREPTSPKDRAKKRTKRPATSPWSA